MAAPMHKMLTIAGMAAAVLVLAWLWYRSEEKKDPASAPPLKSTEAVNSGPAAKPAHAVTGGVVTAENPAPAMAWVHRPFFNKSSSFPCGCLEINTSALGKGQVWYATQEECKKQNASACQ